MFLARMPRLILAILLFLCAAAPAVAQSCETKPAPDIDAPAEVCEMALVNASLAPPATGSWSSATWSISGGSYIIGGSRLATTTGTSVTFEPDGSGDVIITVNAVDSDGCARPPATRSFRSCAVWTRRESCLITPAAPWRRPAPADRASRRGDVYRRRIDRT